VEREFPLRGFSEEYSEELISLSSDDVDPASKGLDLPSAIVKIFVCKSILLLNVWAGLGSIFVVVEVGPSGSSLEARWNKTRKRVTKRWSVRE
jgi:hypothetical protein